MTPKEKAKELFTKFSDLEDGEMYIVKAKQCSTIAVDEIINEYDDNICYCGYDNDDEMWNSKKNWWVTVKQELELL